MTETFDVQTAHQIYFTLKNVCEFTIENWLKDKQRN